VKALRVHARHDSVVLAVEEVDRPTGDVVIAVEFAALNYKDTLIAREPSRVRRLTDVTMGLEATGRVVASDDPSLAVGDLVIAFGGDIGIGRDGTFAQFVSVPARYVTALDEKALSARAAMRGGLAAATAMASVHALLDAGTVPADGDILVTGASGGVGSLAVTFLARRGFRVVASSGSSHYREWLLALGAAEVIGREGIADRPERVLASERWAGAVDCVGGETLHQILRSLAYGGTVAASGLTGGSDLATNVYPFITRAVSLRGIDIVESTSEARRRQWLDIATATRNDDEWLVDDVLALDEVPAGLERLRAGSVRGRLLVSPS
jgi:putative YhdH/YhfP family quinone oxidoreductase